jgi:hypothetical protein
MFYNTCVLFFEFVMCKVLRLGFFYYKVMTFLYIFLGLNPQLETNQTSQPSAPPCPPNMAQKDKKWMKVGRNGNVKLALALSHNVLNGC